MRETAMTQVRAKSIGFMFQTFNLIPTLSAQENVETALMPLRFSGATAGHRAVGALGTVGLADRASTCPRRCPAASSSGSRSPVPW